MYFVLLFPSIGQWTICWWLGQRYSLIYILRFEKPFKTTALKIVFLRNKKIVKKKKSSISFSYFLPRLILPMQVVCGSVLRVGYMNANINLLGTGGTARTPRYNFPQLKALEVVRYVHNWIVYLLLFFFFFYKVWKINDIFILSTSVATRETSFVHAISAAGVMYTLTRNCSLGDLEDCGCDSSRNGKLGKNIKDKFIR